MSRPHRPLARTLTGLLAASALLVGGTVAATPAYAAAPTVTGFSPTSGPVGTSVTIAGTGFAAPGKVTFGGVAATIVKVSSSTSILTQVPPGAVTGKLVVTVLGGSVTSASSYTVTPGAKLSTTAGPPTASTKVSISGFSAFEAVDVYLDTSAVALASADGRGAATATVVFPAATTPGVHWVSAVGRRSGVSAQAAFTVTTAWAQTGFDAAQHHANAYENIVSTSTVGGLEQAWRTGPGGAGVTDGTSVVNGVVYTGFRDGTVRALDAATGKQKWSRSTTFEGNATVGASLVYVAAQDTLLALSTVTGATVWSVTLPQSGALTPLLVGSTVYELAGTSITAYNATTGSQVWAVTATSGLTERIAVQGDVLVVGFSDGTVQRLDPTDGTQRWTTDIGSFVAGVTIVNGLTYVVQDDTPEVVALDIEDGSVAWTTTITGNPAAPSYAKGTLYVGTSSGLVCALSATTGGVQWSTTLTGSPYISAPAAVADGVLYVPTRVGLRALAASYGGLLWSTSDRSYYDSVAVSDGSVFIGTDNSRVVRYALPNASTSDSARPEVRTLHR